MTDSSAWQAIHESGHALCARALGVNVRSATLREVRYQLSGYPTSLRDPNLARELIIAVAGGVAVRLIDPTGKRGDSGDLESARTTLRQLHATSDETFRYMHEARRAARRILKERLPQLAHIAIALHRHGELSGREIDDVLAILVQ